MQEIINKYMGIIASNIKYLRENAHLTQENLAEKIDCSREFINRLENNKEKPSLQTLILLSASLKVHPSVFFNELT